MASEPLSNSPQSNLYSVGGPLTGTLNPSTVKALDDVAINSGIQHGPASGVDKWAGTKNDLMYGVNVDPGSDTTKEPSSGSY